MKRVVVQVIPLARATGCAGDAAFWSVSLSETEFDTEKSPC